MSVALNIKHWFEWDKIEERTILPGLRARFIHSKNMTFALWNIDIDAELPLHSHPHEQVTQMMEGEFKLTIENKAHVLKPGEMAIIPAHANHEGKALTPCRILDIFYPVREDYFDKGKGAFI